MLEARAELLSTGAFEPIAHAVHAGVASSASVASATTPRIADLGCGTGYYSEYIASRSPSAAFLLADRSPIAVRIASRAVPNSTGVVLDLWRPLPIRDASVDIALNVFAPRNVDEFARIIRPGGALVVVVPTERHLIEARAAGAMLDIPSGKVELVTYQLSGAGFDLHARRAVEYTVDLARRDLESLVGMGPSAHHAPENADSAPAAPGAPDTPGDVTVSVDVLVFRRD
ncbi:methyltransferase domain-containing protein [Agromyces arachidis]|uniref:methyltransferase domain-containing protein n=1 Tax=Agromyces arachidis TaxID=766966 RepID=UPI004056B8B5